jgi:hypothetical protein
MTQGPAGLGGGVGDPYSVVGVEGEVLGVVFELEGIGGSGKTKGKLLAGNVKGRRTT